MTHTVMAMIDMNAAMCRVLRASCVFAHNPLWALFVGLPKEASPLQMFSTIHSVTQSAVLIVVMSMRLVCCNPPSLMPV